MNRTYCIFAIHYLPHLGGVERYVYNLSRELIKRNNKVYVVASNTDKLPMVENLEGVKVIRIPCLGFIDGRFPVIIPGREFRKIDRKLKELDIDFFIVNSRFYFHSLYGLHLARKKHVPAIVLDHGTDHMKMPGKVATSIGALFEHMITALEKGLCKDFYGVSGDAAKWLGHFGIRARGVIYNSIDYDRIEELVKTLEPEYRKNYNIPEDALVVTYTGRLVREKGSMQLVKAAKELDKKGKRIYVFIAGDGELMDELKKNACEYIIPLGRLSFEEIIRLLSESDIFCLPTAYPEGFPTSTLEAMAAGCFPVVTENGGARELITGDEFGIILKDNSVESITEAILSICDDPGYRRKVAENGRIRVRDNFTWKNAADIIEAKADTK